MVSEEKPATAISLPAGGKFGEGELKEGFADKGAADVVDRGGEGRRFAVGAHRLNAVEGRRHAFFRAHVRAYAGGFAAGFFNLGEEGLVVGWVAGEDDDGVAGVDGELAVDFLGNWMVVMRFCSRCWTVESNAIAWMGPDSLLCKSSGDTGSCAWSYTGYYDYRLGWRSHCGCKVWCSCEMSTKLT